MLLYKLYQPLWSYYYKFNVNTYILLKRSYNARKIVPLDVIITENPDICKELKGNLSTVEWKNMREKIQKYQEITPAVVDNIILTICQKYSHVDNAIAYFKFLRENDYSLNMAVMGKYLKLYCTKQNLTDMDKVEIVETYNTLRQKYQYLDADTAEACIVSLCLTDEWEETHKIIEMMKITSIPGTNVYSALAGAAFRNGKPDIAWKALSNIMLRKLIPQNTIYSSHAQYCQLEDAKVFNGRMEEMFNFWIRHNIVPYNQIIETYANIASKYGWSTRFLTISRETGNCEHCGYSLSKITFSEKEFQKLAKSVIDRVIIGSDIYRKTNPKELLRFKKFIENTKPYDVIIDGLNLTYIQSSSSSKLLTLINVINYFKKIGRKILVLTRKHQRNLSEFKHIERNAFVFLLDNISVDDPYILYATMESGINAMFVSLDLMRQHKYSLQDEHLQQIFAKWQYSHQYSVKLSGTGVRIQKPVAFMPTVQKNNNCWHVPCVTEDLNIGLYEFPNMWYCFKRNEEK